MNENEMRFGLGCIPSDMDGTEHEFACDDRFEMPEEFSWKDVMPPVKNQGMTSTCVAQSLTGVLDFLYNSENGVTNICNGFSVDELYNSRARKDLQGMTFKEACHYLKHRGLNGVKINSYAKVGSVESMKQAIMMFAPVVIGLPVWNDSKSFWIKQSGMDRFLGGHAVTIIGWNKEGFILRNSWGTNWGSNSPRDGYAIFKFEDFNKIYEAWSVIL